jgi:hypothetical protein
MVCLQVRAPFGVLVRLVKLERRTVVPEHLIRRSAVVSFGILMAEQPDLCGVYPGIDKRALKGQWHGIPPCKFKVIQ